MFKTDRKKRETEMGKSSLIIFLQLNTRDNNILYNLHNICIYIVVGRGIVGSWIFSQSVDGGWVIVRRQGVCHNL